MLRNKFGWCIWYYVFNKNDVCECSYLYTIAGRITFASSICEKYIRRKISRGIWRPFFIYFFSRWWNKVISSFGTAIAKLETPRETTPPVHTVSNNNVKNINNVIDDTNYSTANRSITDAFAEAKFFFKHQSRLPTFD